LSFGPPQTKFLDPPLGAVHVLARDKKKEQTGSGKSVERYALVTLYTFVRKL